MKNIRQSFERCAYTIDKNNNLAQIIIQLEPDLFYYYLYNPAFISLFLI